MNENHARLCPSAEWASYSLLTRLETLGYGAMTISVDDRWTLRARKPDPPRDGAWERTV